nr:hypothetical protein [Kiritimatiellia bacterium]
MKKTFESKCGSALLVTLLVVSLLLVVVTTFSAYVRLELRAVSARMELIKARQNAKLGMHLALARLQETAGPDQRVTATAEILGTTTHLSNLHIAGVWDTQSPNAPPQWLISTPSGAPYDVTTPYPAADTTLLVGPGSLGPTPAPTDVIRAPTISITNPENNGRYAYWVADEGVKASVGLHNPYPATTTLGNLHTTETDRLRYAVPVRNASEFAFSNPLDFEDPQTNAFVGYTHNLNQFSFLTNASNPQQHGGFHTYTHNARGLLTHTVNGGIKKDLSLAPELFPGPGNGFEPFRNYTAYLQEPDPGNFLIETPEDLRRLHRITPPSNLNPVDGEVVHSVVPVITDFGVQFSPHPTSSSNRGALLSMLFVLELWNPYTSGLEAEDLVAEIQGMQPITMILVDPDTDLEVWQHTFDVAETFGETITVRLERGQYHTTTQYLGPNSYDTQVHGPGRLLYWTGPDTNNNRTPDRFTGSFANRSSSNTRLVLPAMPAVNFPPGNHFEVRYQMPETPLTVKLRHAETKQILSIYDNFHYDEVE